MHTHTPYATALGCLEDPTLLMIHQNSCRSGLSKFKDLKNCGNNSSVAEKNYVHSNPDEEGKLFSDPNTTKIKK